MSQADRRRSRRYLPEAESCEGRLLLSLAHLAPGELAVVRPLFMPGYTHPVRPNTPALPYGVASDNSTFIDPSVRIKDGNSIVVGRNSYLAPYGTLDARGGLMKVGAASFLGDNASLVANPDRRPGRPSLDVGEQTVIDAGARVLGNSRVGAFGLASQPTYVGPNAVIDNAVVEPGAYVGALAYVGPGVRVAAGAFVPPGAVVTAPAQLGSGRVTAAQYLQVRGLIADAVALSSGYTTLYQGDKATGPSRGTSTPGIYNGYLPAVEGVSAAPALPTVGTGGLKSVEPSFPSARIGPVPVNLYHFRARIIGNVVFAQPPADISLGLARSDSIRADVGRPIHFDTFGQFGSFVSMYVPRGGKLTVGPSLIVGDHAVIIGGPTASIGANVVIGDGAVVQGSTLGDGVVVGPGAVIQNATVPAGSSIPAGTILVGSGSKP